MMFIVLNMAKLPKHDAAAYRSIVRLIKEGGVKKLKILLCRAIFSQKAFATDSLRAFSPKYKIKS